MPRCRSPRPARIPAARREVSCPGRGAAYFMLLRRAGTHRYEPYAWAPDQQRTACALRGIRGTIPRRLQRRHPMAPAPVIRLHPDDGVLIARSSLPPGMVVAEGVTTVERIPAGHKVAIRPIATGEPVRRYGQIIGFATSPIAPGQHVHTQNCGMGDFAKDYAFGVDVTPTPNFDLPATFDGIRRPDGRVATRNYIGILTSVNCSAHVAVAARWAAMRGMRILPPWSCSVWAARSIRSAG